MGFTIDIDTGGTFTDCFLYGNGAVRTVKVPTTPHDLTVCFLGSIKAGAQAFGLSTEDLLYDTDIIRFSSTIGTNTIIQRDGTRLGLLVTRGAEALAPVKDAGGRPPLVAATMVIGLDESVDADGTVRRAPAPAAILDAAQQLIDRGARCLVVALDNAHCQSANERLVRDVIRREYPRDYLGSVPVFLSSDLSTRPGYGLRINTAALNAYIHGKHARLLYKAGEDLRRLGYRRTLFIGHNTGTVARVAKTRAINTYNSGPAAGLLGAREIGRLYGARHIIATDMGGTSFDIGRVSDGQPGFSLEPDVEGFRCNLPMMAIRALGAGGGSIARVEQGDLRVGPDSAGAAPGPACFGLGGAEPTVTDANLVLGILDPEYFLGGTLRLDVARARAAIENRIAGPLRIGLVEAALRIRTAVEQAVAREVAATLRALAGDSDALMIAYGGAGAIHACAIASYAGMRRIVMTPYSAVSSAFGSALLDAGHLYHRRIDAPLDSPAAGERLGAAAAQMRRDAERDMRGEGFDGDVVRHELQCYLQRADGTEFIVTLPPEPRDAAATNRAARAAATSAGIPDGEVLQVTTLGWLASAAVPHFAPRAAADDHAGRRGPQGRAAGAPSAGGGGSRHAGLRARAAGAWPWPGRPGDRRIRPDHTAAAGRLAAGDRSLRQRRSAGGAGLGACRELKQ
ncbi:MAG: hydantoinase/oxoprolinase family protein [Steroidobacteraceae bacterium]